MAKIPTQQLFDEFFASMNKGETYLRKIRPKADRPEVYAYEKKIGKQLVDMNVDELFDMLRTFNEDGFSISYSSYDSLAVLFRQVFEYYIDHYELIRNPWNNKRMRGMAAYEEIAAGKETISWNDVEAAITEIYKTNETDRAKYIECILRLFYNGFERAEEIVMLKESMIDFKAHTARLSGRVVQLDEQCFNLLVEIHNMSVMKGWRGDYVMASWNDSYFKFPIRPKEESEFDSRPFAEVCNLINRTIAERIRKGLHFDINYRMLYFLGFYDFMIKTYGKERTNRILTSSRVREDVTDLENAARMYGITKLTSSQIKRSMRPFICE